ncbi:MAG: TIR domain-containing protein [Planctomycetia bacterium]|nr:TIR domain-containing protein [Planctomycetia bacterium]
MARRAFYSFHYKPDCSRAAQVRNIGTVEGNKPASDNDWESVTRAGDAAIQKWIDDQLYGKSCAVVLIGAGTAGRKWINYEIKKAWNEKKGLVGVYIHGLKDLSANTSSQGNNPFQGFKVGDTEMTTIVKTYNPPYYDSKQVYGYIAENLAAWFDEAVKIREKY